MTSRHVIQPGATIGMVGGGQLGRMFALAAAEMGYRVGVFCGSSDEPAAQVATFTVCGPLDDGSAIAAFAKRCDVITLEFENIPAESIKKCSLHAPTYPSASVLAIAQDRLLEKSTLRDAGLPVTPFRAVHDAASLHQAASELGLPLIVKTCLSGYDGKGQHRLNDAASLSSFRWLDSERWIAEACVHFDRELSVIVARSVDGTCEAFPVFENRHVHHVLDETRWPALIDSSTEQSAKQIAITAAQTLDVVGLLCVEMFHAGDRLMINEIAPRPHNSGHVTIEASHTSQFHQHVRAICGLPLGDPSMRTPAAGMVNLMGDLWPESGGLPAWHRVLGHPGVSLHLYGKNAARPGRKMGHLTCVGQNPDDVAARLRKAREAS